MRGKAGGAKDRKRKNKTVTEVKATLHTTANSVSTMEG